jgi:hypothetical protein
LPQNDFLVWAPSGGSVMSQAAYAASPSLNNGVVSGPADPTLFNKTQRQSSIIATMLAQFIAQQTGQSVIDDGTTSTILTNFIASLKTIAGNRYSFSLPDSPPASLFALLPGDTLTITHAPTSLVALYVASVPGIYRLTWVVSQSTATGTDVLLFPNGSQHPGAINTWFIEASDSGTGGPPSLSNNAVTKRASQQPYFLLDLFEDVGLVTDVNNDIGPFVIEMTISTYTVSKSVRYTAGIAGGGSAGFGVWNDSTTLWNQLGTLGLITGQLVGGTVFIERVV